MLGAETDAGAVTKPEPPLLRLPGRDLQPFAPPNALDTLVVHPGSKAVPQGGPPQKGGGTVKSEATLDTVRKALARFEDYTSARDFKTFRREQAIGFKERLAAKHGQRWGETLSAATRSVTLSALKDFFTRLAWQPGFKSKIHVPDIDYFSPSMKDSTTAKAPKLRDFPTLEQVRATIASMPADTVNERRNRALIAFTILTGMRDRAIVPSRFATSI